MAVGKHAQVALNPTNAVDAECADLANGARPVNVFRHAVTSKGEFPFLGVDFEFNVGRPRIEAFVLRFVMKVL